MIEATPSTRHPDRLPAAADILRSCWLTPSALARRGLGRQLADEGIPTELVALEAEAQRLVAKGELSLLLVDLWAHRSAPLELIAEARNRGITVVGVVLGSTPELAFGAGRMGLAELIRPPLSAHRIARMLRGARERVVEGWPPVVDQMVAALCRIAAEADPGNIGHGQRTADYSVAIARQLGLDATTCRTLRVAALLHDIGKVRVPRELLLKPTHLDAEEYREVQRHAEVGHFLLQPLERIEAVGLVARSHHERFDGGGYPDGLAGGDIPKAARIVSVADVFDSLTSRRPYRNPMSLDRALGTIREQAGTQFDPDAVAALEVWIAAGTLSA